MIKLNPGTALDHDGAYAIRRGGNTHVIGLLGAIGSGKTTLIAGLLQAFLSGPLASYRFRRSDKLVAFEERCFDSRVASGAAKASTVRTSSLSGQHYYHLEVMGDAGDPMRLLLLDMSGEFYEAALSSNDDAAQLKSLIGVDRIVHLLDGWNLSDTVQREKVFSDTKKLMRRLYEREVIMPTTPLDMVVSKLDQLATAPDAQTVAAAIQNVQRRFSREIERFGWSFSGVASSPEANTDFPVRFGLGSLLSVWLAEPHAEETVLPRIRVKSGPFSPLASAWAPERYVRE